MIPSRSKSNSFIIILISSILLAVSCNSRMKMYPVNTLGEFSNVESQEKKERANCNSWESYVPSESYPDNLSMKKIRVNFHYMNNSDSSVNYLYPRAKKYTKDLLKYAHDYLRNNKKMQIPLHNDVPNLATSYRYELTTSEGYEKFKGVYVHYDDELYYYLYKGKNRNLGSRELYDKYAIGADSILNIFMIPHHPDSLKSSTYGGGGAKGVALGSHVKISGLSAEKFNPWANRGNFNHEVGHIFGLGHAWRRDGCEDTPEHKNDCYSKTRDGSKCDSLFTNNVMDYNTFQESWTPCQIGRMHSRMSDVKSRVRKFVKKTWCQYDEAKSIYISGNITWTGSRDLEGDLIVESGGKLKINCRVSIPPGGKIQVKNGGTLVLNNSRLHNDCDKKWKGIFIERNRKNSGQIHYSGEPIIEDTEIEFVNILNEKDGA